MSTAQHFVGNYRMFHLVRAGAIYEIWAVRPISETTPFAMKWLPPGPKHTRQAVNELKHEFTVGSTLDHPAVIKTYEYDTTSNGTYMLLELFKVLNLKQQIVAGHRKLLPRVKEIMIQMAAGLAHLHEKGWVHRDIKPDNFLVSNESVVKLIDFNLARKPAGGLAKLFGGKSKVQGTYSYMAPEQIRGKAIHPAADIYSLGCVFHELLSGKPPFTGNSPTELLQRHLRAKPSSLTVADKNITPEFADYVLRMMSKDPSVRPASMKDVQMEVKAVKMFYNPPQEPSGEEQKAAEEADGT